MTFTTKEKGTGLGLSIVKKICDENGWKILIKSTIRKGTEVMIQFH